MRVTRKAKTNFRKAVEAQYPPPYRILGFTKSNHMPTRADRRWRDRTFNSLKAAVVGFREVIGRGHRNLFLIDGNETVFVISTRFVDAERS